MDDDETVAANGVTCLLSKSAGHVVGALRAAALPALIIAPFLPQENLGIGLILQSHLLHHQ
jgi:hypothetical protein